MTRQIEDYERNIRLTERSVEVENQKWNQAVQDKEVHIRNLEAMRAEENRIWSEREKSLHEQLQNDKEDFLKREEQLQSELRQQAECIRKKDAKAQEQEKANQRLQEELSHYKEHYLAAIGQREELNRQLAAVQKDYRVLLESDKTAADYCKRNRTSISRNDFFSTGSEGVQMSA